MSKLPTYQVAKKLGLDASTLGRYIKAGKVTAPPETEVGGYRIRLWSESDIEKLKEVLPKIKNGRKVRYQKLREKEKTQARASPPQPRQKRPGPGTPAPVPHKSRSAKRKKTNK